DGSWIRRATKLNSSNRQKSSEDRRRLLCLRDVGEAYIVHGVRVPVTVVEMPPLKLVDRESFRLHRRSQHLTVLPLLGSAAGVIGMTALRHFVVTAGHRDGPAGRAIEER